ncbi:MAG: nucleotide sugar dehydrogenase [Pseudomonadota bacterium]
MSTAANDALPRLQQRLADRSAVVAVLGLGYVGLPLALLYAEAGFDVIGFDVDDAKVAALDAGRSYIEHIAAERIARAVADGLEPTTDVARAAAADALLVCVPTPLDRFRQPDLRFITATLDAFAPHVTAGQILSLESTTYPGTTEEEVQARMEQRGFVVGRDVFVVYSPEREDPGNVRFSTATIPKVVGGITPACTAAGAALYGAVIDQVVPVSSARVAEMTKMMENIQRAVNIGLANELKVVCDAMGIDVFEVVRAAATKPFGFVPYLPGPGIGGHCIPVDPFYLTWKAREYGVHTRFVELAGEINAGMPDYVVGKLSDALNDRGRALKGAGVLVLGIAYKPDVDDVRESPAIEVMERLRDKGVRLAYSDPHVPQFKPMRAHRFDLESVALDPQTLAAYDAVVLTTDHSGFDYAMIGEHARLIVDTRGRFPIDAANVQRA